MNIRYTLPVVSLLFVLGITACDTEAPFRKVTYVADVEPIVQQHCLECHAAGGQGAEKSGYLMDSYEDVMKGTKFGPVIVPGSSESSSLYRMVAGKTDPAIRMPHGKVPLSDEQIKTIQLWIDKGAIKD
ncbi:MAG: hypothetical protein PVH54_06910 [Gammaproteobacteria bacterium]|jgi:hypothetical protein